MIVRDGESQEQWEGDNDWMMTMKNLYVYRQRSGKCGLYFMCSL